MSSRAIPDLTLRGHLQRLKRAPFVWIETYQLAIRERNDLRKALEAAIDWEEGMANHLSRPEWVQQAKEILAKVRS